MKISPDVKLPTALKTRAATDRITHKIKEHCQGKPELSLDDRGDITTTLNKTRISYKIAREFGVSPGSLGPIGVPLEQYCDSLAERLIDGQRGLSVPLQEIGDALVTAINRCAKEIERRKTPSRPLPPTSLELYTSGLSSEEIRAAHTQYQTDIDNHCNQTGKAWDKNRTTVARAISPIVEKLTKELGLDIATVELAINTTPSRSMEGLSL